MDKDNVKKVTFREVPLTLHEPAWGSSLATTIIELERLRVKRLTGPVPSYVFFQLKNIFQMLESLGSARIEGNRTTLAEFVERVIEQKDKPKDGDSQIREIANIESAMGFIEEHVQAGTIVPRALLSEVHKIVVKDLPLPPDGEGSSHPGQYRPMPVTIQKSDHVPPEPIQVPDYMEALFKYVNEQVDQKNA